MFAQQEVNLELEDAFHGACIMLEQFPGHRHSAQTRRYIEILVLFRDVIDQQRQDLNDFDALYSLAASAAPGWEFEGTDLIV
jgi:hypothetical protein